VARAFGRRQSAAGAAKGGPLQRAAYYATRKRIFAPRQLRLPPALSYFITGLILGTHLCARVLAVSGVALSYDGAWLGDSAGLFPLPVGASGQLYDLLVLAGSLRAFNAVRARNAIGTGP
jgi:hypothetical protein